jgi:hypothetical protein
MSMSALSLARSPPENHVIGEQAFLLRLIQDAPQSRHVASLIRAFTRGGRDDASYMKPPEKDHEAEYKDQISRHLERNRAS